MNDDSKENRPRMRYVRYAVFFLAAALVVSLGFAVIPGGSPAPEPPTRSEQARSAALDDALQLRSAALDLAGGAAADGGAPGPVDRVVTLLTVQARTLLPAASSATPGPGAAPPANATTAPGTAASPAAISTRAASPGAAPSPDAANASGPPAASSSPEAGPHTVADLARAVAASGARRLQDAEETDGGMARLLAGAGTAQLLAAGQLAAAAGDPAAAQGLPSGGSGSGAADSQSAGGGSAAGSFPTQATGPGNDSAGQANVECPFAAPTGGTAPAPGTSGEGTPPAGSAAAGTAGAALTAVLRVEQETVYGYQAAMPRLAPSDAGPASDFLEQHKDLVAAVESQLRLECQVALPQAPGYVLGPGFLQAPAAGLGNLEAAALPAYGDLVAVTDGTDRAWAITALRSAVARSAHWGADPGPVPGIILDLAALPALPALGQRHRN